MSNINPRRARSRSAILDVAWRLIAERGLDVGMAEIAEAVGMTRQSIYVHFKTRGGLLVALVRRADEREGIVERLQDALATPEPHARFDAFLREWFAFAGVIHPVARHLIAARLHDVDADEAWNDRMDEFYEGCLALTTSLRREGVLARGWTAPTAADYLWAGASVQAWALLAVERATGEAKAGRLLRTGLRASLLVAHE